jgi:hypothetical protein
MKKQTTKFAVAVAATIILGGCATTQNVVVSPVALTQSFSTAHLVLHGEPSDDVDASIQRELLLRGLEVSAGEEAAAPEDVDLIVRYVDDWKWDVTMYLRRLDIQVYEGGGRTLLASATWKNSALHGYHGLDKVVSRLVQETFSKLGPP